MKELIRKKIRYRKISTKMTVSFLAACIFPLVIAAVVVYTYSARQLHLSALEFAEVFTSQIIENLDSRYNEFDRTTKSILYDSDILNALTGSEDESISGRAEKNFQVRRLLMKVKTLQPDLCNVMFFMNSGDTITFNDYGLSVDEKTLAKEDWLSGILSSGETLKFSELHEQDYLIGRKKTLVVTISRKIYDYHHNYLGILLMDLEADRLLVLSDAFSGSRNSYNIRINVSSLNGLPVYDSDLAAGLKNMEAVIAEAGRMIPEQAGRDYIVYTQQTEKTSLTVNVVIPRGQLLMRIGAVRTMTVAALAIGVLLVLLISALLGRSLSRPMQAIRTQMSEAEQGNYQALVYSTDTEEMGELIDSYNHMIARIEELIEDVYLAQIKQKNAQFVALQTQINPHMLYNTLEAIRMKAMMRGADDVAEMIKILSKMFKSVLNQNGSHTIADELDYARTYLQIQNIRKQDMFSLTVDVPRELYEVPVIPVIIQPVIENSIRHGFRGFSHPLHIRVAGMRDGEGAIHLLVSDDGRGMSAEEIRKKNEELLQGGFSREFLDPGATEEGSADGHGIGLENIRDRLKLYYGEKACVRFSLTGEGCLQVELCIPEKARGERTDV